MLKLMTRSLILRDDIDMRAEIGRAFIEAYIQAAREMPLPWLTHVETRQTHSDVQFVLTFDSVQMRTERSDEAINCVFEVPKRD